MSIGFKLRSTSNWEESDFGGFRKTLWDYPELSVDPAVEFELDKDNDLNYYLGGKIMKLFLIKTSEMTLNHHLLKKMTIEKGMKVPFFKNPVSKAVVDKAQQEAVFNAVMTKDDEMRNMLLHYKKEILSTKITIRIPEDMDKSEDEKPEKGDSSSEEGKKPENKEGDAESKTGEKKTPEELYAEQLNKQRLNDKLKEILGRARERKNLFDLGKKSDEDEIRDISVDFTKVGKSKVYYNPEEILASERLLNSLDISFESDSDKIKSLRSGKIDSGKIAEFMAGNGNIYYRIEEDQITKPFSICILGDFSGSMGDSLLRTQASFIRVLYKAFSQILPPDKLFIYGHSGSNDSVIYTFHEPGFTEFSTTGGGLSSYGKSQNYDGPAIEAVHKRVRDFTDDNIIFIAISDGAPSGIGYGGWSAVNHMKKAIERAKRDGFVTVGIGLQLNLVKEIYNYYSIINNVSELAQKATTLLNRVVKTEFQ